MVVDLLSPIYNTDKAIAQFLRRRAGNNNPSTGTTVALVSQPGFALLLSSVVLLP